MLVTWMSFASGIRDLRGGALSMLETHHDEFFDFPTHSYSRASPCTSSHAFPQFSYGHNHHSYGFHS
jgi:hypothetical protein